MTQEKKRCGYVSAGLSIQCAVVFLLVFALIAAIPFLLIAERTLTAEAMSEDFMWDVPVTDLEIKYDDNGGCIIMGIKEDALSKRVADRIDFFYPIFASITIPERLDAAGIAGAEAYTDLPVVKIADEAFYKDVRDANNAKVYFYIESADFSQAKNLAEIGEKAFYGHQMKVIDLLGATALTTIHKDAFTSGISCYVAYLDEIDDIGDLAEPDGLELIIAADLDAFDYYCDQLPLVARDKMTFEITQWFMDEHGNKEIAPSQRKLANKSLQYEKDADNYWHINEKYQFPEVERIYGKMCYWVYAGGWRIVLPDSSAGVEAVSKLCWTGDEFEALSVTLTMPDETKLYTTFDCARLSDFLIGNGFLDVKAVVYGLPGDSMTDYSLSFEHGGEFLLEGENAIIVTLDGIKNSFTVYAEWWRITSAEILTQPIKTTYKAFETFDAAGLQFTAAYNDGASADGIEYAVRYQNGDCFRAGDTKVFLDLPLYPGSLDTVSMDIEVSVSKTTFDLAAHGIAFENKTIYYDGKAHSLSISGRLPEFVTVSYDVTGVTETGEYLVTATFHIVMNVDDYNLVPPMTATLTIIQKPLSPWAVTGIVLGGIALLSGAAFITVYILKRKTRGFAADSGVAANPPPLSGDEVDVLRQIITHGQSPPSAPALPEDLTLREREVARLLKDGKTNKEIAAALFISDETVKNHIKSVLRKSNCRSRLSFAAKYGNR